MMESQPRINAMGGDLSENGRGVPLGCMKGFRFEVRGLA
jgi:hypothetical protein